MGERSTRNGLEPLSSDELADLRGYLASRDLDLQTDHAAARVRFWSRAAACLEPEEVGRLLTLKELNEERDGLTGILNRRGLERALEEALERTKRERKPLSVVFMDLDRFKFFNDTYGHQLGDAVLTAWVQFLRDNIRKTDSLGRYGGEEVVAILPNATEHQGYLMFNRIRERMTSALHQVLLEAQVDATITMSVGVAQHKPPETAEQLLQRADERMYQAKAAGRNLVIGGVRDRK